MTKGPRHRRGPDVGTKRIFEAQWEFMWPSPHLSSSPHWGVTSMKLSNRPLDLLAQKLELSVPQFMY
jgi:hypothetical protein